MRTSIRVSLGVGAFVLSVLAGAIAFLVTAALVVGVPIWSVAIIIGRNALHSSPAHGGGLALVAMFFAVPLAAAVFVAVVVLLTPMVYRRLERSVGRAQ